MFDKHSIKSISLHIFISLVLLVIGLYVLIEKKMVIAGKLTGEVYEFSYPTNIIIAVSFFLESLFTILILVENKKFKKLSEWVLIVALTLFVIGVFM